MPSRAETRALSQLARVARPFAPDDPDDDDLLDEIGDTRLVLQVRPALEGSYEALVHEAGLGDVALGDFLLSLRTDRVLRDALAGPWLERAIGVIYRPETERLSHYFKASLPEQFDAILHIDRTRALIPLEKTVPWHQGETAETFPSAL